MAKSTGPLHSDKASGSLGALTHRTFRGTGTISRHRSKSRVKHRRKFIDSPLDILDCFSLHSAGVGYTLRNVGGIKYLVKLNDQVDGFGPFIQSVNAYQPLWMPSDPDHGNRPYLLFDGINDSIPTVPLDYSFGADLEMWFICSDCGVVAYTFLLFSISSLASRYLDGDSRSSVCWQWLNPSQINLKPYGDTSVKIWRVVFTCNTIQIFINGIPQTLPRTILTDSFNRLVFSGTIVAGHAYPGKLFEISTWRRILNPVEVALLLRYYTETFNIF